MAPSFRSGRNAFFSLVSATGGTINLSSGLSDSSLARIAAALKVTTYGKNDEVYIPGLRDSTIKLVGIWASTYEAKLAATLGSTAAGAWTYGPESTATGRRKMTGSSVVTQYNVGAPVGDKVNMDLTLQCSGAVTATVF